jgi:hypothetical protein
MAPKCPKMALNGPELPYFGPKVPLELRKPKSFPVGYIAVFGLINPKMVNKPKNPKMC